MELARVHSELSVQSEEYVRSRECWRVELETKHRCLQHLEEEVHAESSSVHELKAELNAYSRPGTRGVAKPKRRETSPPSSPQPPTVLTKAGRSLSGDRRSGGSIRQSFGSSRTATPGPSRAGSVIAAPAGGLAPPYLGQGSPQPGVRRTRTSGISPTATPTPTPTPSRQASHVHLTSVKSNVSIRSGPSSRSGSPNQAYPRSNSPVRVRGSSSPSPIVVRSYNQSGSRSSSKSNAVLGSASAPRLGSASAPSGASSMSAPSNAPSGVGSAGSSGMQLASGGCTVAAVVPQGPLLPARNGVYGPRSPPRTRLQAGTPSSSGSRTPEVQRLHRPSRQQLSPSQRRTMSPQLVPAYRSAAAPSVPSAPAPCSLPTPVVLTRGPLQKRPQGEASRTPSPPGSAAVPAGSIPQRGSAVATSPPRGGFTSAITLPSSPPATALGCSRVSLGQGQRRSTLSGSPPVRQPPLIVGFMSPMS